MTDAEEIASLKEKLENLQLDYDALEGDAAKVVRVFEGLYPSDLPLPLGRAIEALRDNGDGKWWVL